MDLFNFSFQSHDDLEDLRYSHSPASTPNLVEAPPDRVQSMHLSTKDHVMEDESDPTMQTLDLLDGDHDTPFSETELEPEMGAQKKTAKGSGICPTPMKSTSKPRSFLGGTTPAAYISQCFDDAKNGSKKSSKEVSPSSIYSRPQTLQQQKLDSLPQTKYEIVAHNNHPTNILRPAARIHTPSPLSQSFHPPSITTAEPPIATDLIHTSSHITNSYRLTPASNRWPPRKESLPSMLINTQSFMRYSNEHAPSPPPLQLQGLAKRRWSPPFLAPIDVKKSFEASDCLTFGISRKTAIRGVQDDNGVGEKIVRLRVKRRDGSLREVGRERSQIIIPKPCSHPPSEYPASQTNIPQAGGAAGTHIGQNFSTWDFDDKLFFEELRHEYARLTGSSRYLSARSLRTIRPNVSTEMESDSFSEAEMMKGFLKPASGKGRYGWVQWIHRLSSQPEPPTQQTPTPKKSEGAPSPSPLQPHNEPLTLTFHLSWSPHRILTALLLTVLTSLSIALLWILLGTRTASNGVQISLNEAGVPQAKWAVPSDAVGFRFAGERVAGGMLAGIFALLVGVVGVVGWGVWSWVCE